LLGRDRRDDRWEGRRVHSRDLRRQGGGLLPGRRGGGPGAPGAQERRRHRHRRRPSLSPGAPGRPPRAGDGGLAVGRLRRALPARAPRHRGAADAGPPEPRRGGGALPLAGALLRRGGLRRRDHGPAGRVREINLRGAKLARDVRESMGRDVFVLGSMGPLGKYLAPLGSVDPEEARAAFREQAEGLVEGGVDALIVETFSDLVEMRLAVEAIRSVTELPIVTQVAFTDDGVTFLGRAAADVARTLRELPIQAVGANCSVGSSVLYDILEQMVPEAGGLPVV